MINTRQLADLLAVIEHRHFRDAARALGVSQPTLTKSIQRLESELGVQLLERRHHGVSPTPIGQRVIDHARQVVADMDQLEKEVGLLSGAEIGTLAIGVGPAMSETFVSAMIGQFAEQYPELQINVRVDHWTQLSDWLHAGELDLYVADVASAGRDARVTTIAMPRERFVWFCRAGHPLAGRRRLKPSEIFAWPVATPKPPPWAQVWFAEAAGTPDDVQRRYHTVQCESYSMLKQIVRSSNCVSASLESSIAHEIEAGMLVALNVARMTLKTSAGIIYRKDRMLPPAAQKFIDMLQARSRSKPRASSSSRGKAAKRRDG
jgi:DNA-binding transcriptional LysR family regulator